MENKRVAALLYQHNISLDIWSEILPCLPVKSLVRFRCVSKSWKSLIDDPDFCHLHLNRFKNNSDETHLLVVKGSATNCVIRCSETYNTTERLGNLGNWDKNSKTYKSTALPGYDGCWIIKCEVDGLFLLRGIAPEFESMLWNPSIRKCRLIPKLPDVSSDRTKYVETVELGLGFDPSIKDYKLVRAVLRKQIVPLIAIYTVGTGSWKTIKFQESGPSEGKGLYGRSLCGNVHESVYFKGRICFISSIRQLVSFDLTSEVFTFTDVPAYDVELDYLSLVFVDGGCSLAVFCFSPYLGSIWVFMGNPNSDSTSLCWTERCRFTTSIPSFFYLKKNGDMLLRSSSDHELKSYNIETRTRRPVPKTTRSVVLKVCRYRESLILLK